MIEEFFSSQIYIDEKKGRDKWYPWVGVVGEALFEEENKLPSWQVKNHLCSTDELVTQPYPLNSIYWKA